MLSTNAWLIVGKLVAPQGLKGEIRINPSSDFPERFTKPGPRWIQEKDKEPKPIELLAGRQLPGKSLYVVRFAEVNDRDQAKSLIGQKLLVPASDRPHLNKGEFHLIDLLNLKVKLKETGTSIGKVTDLKSAGNDLLEITLETGGKVLVPFVETIVPEVNLEDKWLTINPPKGLLEL